MVRGRVAKRPPGRTILFAVSFALLLGLLTIVQSLLVRGGAQFTVHAEELTVPALRYQLLDKFGRILFCDSDFVPVNMGVEQAHAVEAFPAIRGVPAVFKPIVRHLGLDKVTDFSAEQKLLVYREFKQLSAIELSPLDGKYKFSLVVSSTSDPAYEGKLTSLIEGTIDDRGTITISKQEPHELLCPICMAGTTRIDTPRGPTAVRDLRIGMVVWTADRAGNRHEAPIIRTSRTPVATHHEMVDLVLDDGRELIASPGHPTIDGRVIGTLSAGDSLDGRRIVSTKRISYTEGYTYDILPAGETGTYWAGGIRIASTLFDTQAKNSIR